MPVNNPAGENGTGYFGGFGGETEYGAVKRLKDTIRAAPLPPNQSVNAPDRARKQRGKSPQPQPVPVEQQLLASPPPPHAIWAEVMGVPGIRADLIEAWANGA